MQTISFIVWRENNEFVAQCLNVDVSSHGNTREEAIENLKEAVELYCHGQTDCMIPDVESIFFGKETINV